MENTIRHQFYLEVGKSIRTARMRSNYSQLDLAKKLNMSRVSVFNQLNIFEQIISSSTKERNFGDDASQKLNSFISEM